MDKYNEILINKKYLTYLKELEELEKHRIFCRHNLEHFLSVARISYIKVLEKRIDISKDVIYAVGLLHDLGRVLEYRDGTPHHLGSVIIAKEILEETSYNNEEIRSILKAIESHRDSSVKGIFQKIIEESDKQSRNCFNCKAEDQCYWKKEKKNFKLKY